MIPSLVVDDIRTSLVEFLSSSFALADDDVRDGLSTFLTDQNDGIFRGPYLRVRTPFVAVDSQWKSPLGWLPQDFRPYHHQATAFERLSTADGREAQPTIVTTGTGSGKTECFLMPLLDHCARQRSAGAEGIKALILYPMNALASDQAGRIARLIHDDTRLKGLTAGLYIGENGSFGSMGPDHLIDKREVMRDDPPDILLTNYKMLDFLLLRREPDTLQYVVLDEFHTYDGAQGTDVAMLLRRLGASLGMARPGRPLGAAVPVATSATLGSGSDALTELRQFAGKIFGVDFGPTSIVGETRQSMDDACGPLNNLAVPEVADVIDAMNDGLEAVATLFCGPQTASPKSTDALGQRQQAASLTSVVDPIDLGERLLGHPLTRAVLAAVGEQPRTWAETVAEVVRRTPTWDPRHQARPADVHRALGQFLALLSIARRKQGGHVRPLFSIEVQLWVREVSRLLRDVQSAPSFRWRDSAAAEASDHLRTKLKPAKAAVNVAIHDTAARRARDKS